MVEHGCIIETKFGESVEVIVPHVLLEHDRHLLHKINEALAGVLRKSGLRTQEYDA